MKHDIFISYRRETGFEAARMIQERLKNSGYRVFLDFEELRSGNFNKQLYEKIESCTDFVLIVSPHCFDRCNDKNDWLRLEIMHALKMGKNIIPVMLRNSEFPRPMPDGMDGLQYMQGVSANQEFFDASIKKLKSYLLTKPNLIRRYSTLLIIVGAILGMSILFYTIYEINSNKEKEEIVKCSSEQASNQKRFVLEQIGNLLLLNEMVYELNEEINASLKDHDTYKSLNQSPRINNWSDRLHRIIQKWKGRPFIEGDYRNKYLFSNEDLNVYAENYLSQELHAIGKTFNETFTRIQELYADVEPSLWLVHSKEHILLQKEIFNLQARDYLLTIMGSSEYLCEEVKDELKDILPGLTEFGDDNRFISLEEAERLCATNLERLEEKIRVLSTYIGDEQINLLTKQHELIKNQEGLNELLDLIAYLNYGLDKSSSTFDTYFPLLQEEWKEGDSPISLRQKKSKIICTSLYEDYSTVFSEDKLYADGLNLFKTRLSSLGFDDSSISTAILELESILNYQKNLLNTIASVSSSSSLNEGLNKTTIIELDKKIQDNHIHAFYLNFKDALESNSGSEFPEIREAYQSFGTLNKEEYTTERLREERQMLLGKKQGIVENMGKQLEAMQKQIQEGHARIKEQCRPLLEDDPWRVWGKMTRLLYLNFKSEALENLDSFEKKMKEDGNDPGNYTIATRRYIQEKYNIECQCGLVVAGFKDDLPHSSLKVGDIITAVNEVAVVTVSDFSEYRKSEGIENTVMRVYRYNSNTMTFSLVDCKSASGDPLIALLGLTEDND